MNDSHFNKENIFVIMKLLFAALEYDYGIPDRGESGEIKFFLPALKDSFEDVVLFPIEKNGFPNDIKGLQKRLLDFVLEVQPDVVFFVLMKDEILPETVKTLSEKYITINWFCDDQWRFDNYTQYIAPLFSLPITVDKYSLSKYRKIGCDTVFLSQWAAFDYCENLNLIKYNDGGGGGYKYNVSFVGSKNATRSWIIYELKKRGVIVECFGSGWKNGRIGYEEMKDVFLYSKINLNLSNSMPSDYRFIIYLLKNIFRLPIRETLRNIREFMFSLKRMEQIKARNFEIPGCGGFELSQYCLDLENYYKIGEEMLVFSNIDELERLIHYYLSNDSERENIRDRAYERTKQHRYTYRFKEIAQYIESYNK